MALLERVATLVRANLNVLIDQAEEPATLVTRFLRARDPADPRRPLVQRPPVAPSSQSR